MLYRQTKFIVNTHRDIFRPHIITDFYECCGSVCHLPTSDMITSVIRISDREVRNHLLLWPVSFVVVLKR